MVKFIYHSNVKDLGTLYIHYEREYMAENQIDCIRDAITRAEKFFGCTGVEVVLFRTNSNMKYGRVGIVKV